MLDDSVRCIIIDTIYNGESFDATLVQRGKSIEDLEVTRTYGSDIKDKK